MVFRRFRKMVRRAKKSTWYGKRYMSKGGSGRLIRDVQWLKGKLNTELKRCDIQIGTANIPATGTWQLYTLNETNADIDSLNSRVGSAIRCKSVQVRGKVSGSAVHFTNAPYDPMQVRVVIFVDRYPTIGTPALTTMFNTSVATSTVYSMRQWNSTGLQRFQVLYDRTFSVDNSRNEHFYKFYKKLHLKTVYDEITTGSITNRIHLAVFADHPAAGNTTHGFESRVTYIDN